MFWSFARLYIRKVLILCSWNVEWLEIPLHTTASSHHSASCRHWSTFSCISLKEVLWRIMHFNPFHFSCLLFSTGFAALFPTTLSNCEGLVWSMNIHQQQFTCMPQLYSWIAPVMQSLMKRKMWDAHLENMYADSNVPIDGLVIQQFI